MAAAPQSATLGETAAAAGHRNNNEALLMTFDAASRQTLTD